MRGLGSKSKDFYLAIQSANYDFVALTETWFTESHLDNEFFTNEYILYRKDRWETNSTASRGGGVAIAINSQFHSSSIPLAEEFNQLEAISVRVTMGHKKFIIYCCYIPPNMPTELYELHLKAISNLKDDDHTTTFVIGDFNLPKIVWTQSPDDPELIYTFTCIL